MPLVVKTSDRVSSSGSEETLMDRSSFVFELGSKLCLFIFFPANNVRSSKNCKVAPISRKVAPSRRVTGLPQLPWASQNFLHFLTETWRLNTLETNSGLERFFDGKVTFLAKPGQLGQGERIRPSASLF